jgi:hypothetical protein
MMTRKRNYKLKKKETKHKNKKRITRHKNKLFRKKITKKMKGSGVYDFANRSYNTIKENITPEKIGNFFKGNVQNISEYSRLYNYAIKRFITISTGTMDLYVDRFIARNQDFSSLMNEKFVKDMDVRNNLLFIYVTAINFAFNDSYNIPFTEPILFELFDMCKFRIKKLFTISSPIMINYLLNSFDRNSKSNINQNSIINNIKKIIYEQNTILISPRYKLFVYFFKKLNEILSYGDKLKVENTKRISEENDTLEEEPKYKEETAKRIEDIEQVKFENANRIEDIEEVKLENANRIEDKIPREEEQKIEEYVTNSNIDNENLVNIEDLAKIETKYDNDKYEYDEELNNEINIQDKNIIDEEINKNINKAIVNIENNEINRIENNTEENIEKKLYESSFENEMKKLNSYVIKYANTFKDYKKFDRKTKILSKLNKYIFIEDIIYENQLNNITPFYTKKEAIIYLCRLLLNNDVSIDLYDNQILYSNIMDIIKNENNLQDNYLENDKVYEYLNKYIQKTKFDKAQPVYFSDILYKFPIDNNDDLQVKVRNILTTQIYIINKLLDEIENRINRKELELAKIESSFIISYKLMIENREKIVYDKIFKDKDNKLAVELSKFQNLMPELAVKISHYSCSSPTNFLSMFISTLQYNFLGIIPIGYMALNCIVSSYTYITLNTIFLKKPK